MIISQAEVKSAVGWLKTRVENRSEKKVEGWLAGETREKRKEDSAGSSLFPFTSYKSDSVSRLVIFWYRLTPYFAKYTGPRLCRAFRRQGRRAEQMTHRQGGMNFRRTNREGAGTRWGEGLEISGLSGGGWLHACGGASRGAEHRIHNIYHLPSGHLCFMDVSQRFATRSSMYGNKVKMRNWEKRKDQRRRQNATVEGKWRDCRVVCDYTCEWY